jgi:tRNA (mo5U34)-methyltransferase
MDANQLGPWFHNLHLPDGSETCPNHPLGDFPSFKWAQIAACLPQDLHGATALDIGCNAGFYSIELARRGADVVAIDIDEHYLKQARWARGRFGLDHKIELRQASVYALHTLERRFDVVLFMGVLYHLRHPLLALDIVSRRVGGKLVFQTMTLPGDEVAPTEADPGLDGREALLCAGWPKMAFVEHRLADDPTNWWVPSHACVEAMLRTCGLRVRQRPGHEIYVCTPDHPRDEVVAGLVAAELRSVREVW